MADAEIVEMDAEGAEPIGATRPNARRKWMLIAGAVAAALLLVAGVTTFLMTRSDGGEGGAKAAAGKAEYVDVPEMIVNLRSPDGAAHFLKVHLMLVPGASGSTDTLTSHIPALLDAYQPFLRELRPEDLAGSAAVFRIKEELLRRSAAVLGDGAVKDVLVQDLVQQ
ncbi:flagellar basal body-associated FliL family protein [uncultured Sphingomonas sp.]|uniref:flagellar basal body-associated FliL family protein n=1 Tax=uncultured Sphingomonas sp. TaxID=158754 RepID=UPI0026354A6E|nr:flagellar basal body-associated FliL family protein [uncultured Sphingomonas sp.]